MHIGEIIKDFRKQNKLSMEAFAKQASMSKAYVSVLERNKRPNTDKPVIPSIPTIKNVANAMGISFDELFNMLDDTQLISLESKEFTNENTDILSIYNDLHHPRQQKVYHYAKEQLAEQQAESNVVHLSDTIEEDTEPYQMRYYGPISAGTGEWVEDEHVEMRSFEQVPFGADFCLKVNGDSMEPTFHNGEYVFIRKEEEARNGTIGAIIVNGDAFLKKIVIEDNDIRLVSLNPAYDDIIITEHDTYRYVGTVVL